MSTWVGQYAPLYNFFVMWTKVHQVSFVQRGRGCSWSTTCYIFDMPTRSWDIRDQSRKLSKIAPKFWHFLALPNFRGRAFRKLYARYHPCLATRRLEKFHEDIPSSPEVIGVHTLNFKPNFKFSRLEFFGGTPVPLRVSLLRLGQSLARVIFSGRSTPYGLKYSLPKKYILLGPNSHVIPSR